MIFGNFTDMVRIGICENQWGLSHLEERRASECGCAKVGSRMDDTSFFFFFCKKEVRDSRKFRGKI